MRNNIIFIKQNENFCYFNKTINVDNVVKQTVSQSATAVKLIIIVYSWYGFSIYLLLVLICLTWFKMVKVKIIGFDLLGEIDKNMLCDILIGHFPCQVIGCMFSAESKYSLLQHYRKEHRYINTNNSKSGFIYRFLESYPKTDNNCLFRSGHYSSKSNEE